MRGISQTVTTLILMFASLLANAPQLFLSTDKARYNPDEKVVLTIQSANVSHDSKAKISIYHLEKPIFLQTLNIPGNGETRFSWVPPRQDFKGYLVHVQIGQDIQSSIAVDVSSDWAKYIRYGFLSKFPQMQAEEMDSVLNQLNRFHINGLQFYDYHYMHQKPLKLKNGKPVESWPDIAGRWNYSGTVSHYIQKSSQLNMKSMAYNLIYGSWKRALGEDVKQEWQVYKDPDLSKPYILDFPDTWEDDIVFLNPGNREWQNYLISHTKPVFDVMHFDGWHVDQIGDINPLYDQNRKKVVLDSTFSAFLQEAKKQLKVPLVMNAVNQYGQECIAASGAVEFLYTEVWDPHVTFEDLVSIIKTNDKLGNDQHSTVLAAYMNYEKSNEEGYFNTPGILLTDAVIFASGAAHLELGEHMLVHEYFPNDHRKTDQNLNESLIRYYDFMTAYENLLRDSRESKLSINCQSHPFSSKPEAGKIWISQRKTGRYTVYHLINFTHIKEMNWRDPQGTCPEPQVLTNIKLVPVSQGKAFYASPDNEDLRLFPLKDDQKIITLPFLKYWTMVIVKD